MNQKQIGIVLLVLGILIVLSTHTFYQKEEWYIEQYELANNGSCYLEDNTCLHSDRDFTPYILGYALAVALLLFGIFLVFIDKTQEFLAEHQKQITSALKESKEKESFSAFLEGFTDEEKEIIKIIKAEEGITQSTVRYKLNMSKATLSGIIKDLEKKGIVSKTPAGKTNKLFLKKTL